MTIQSYVPVTSKSAIDKKIARGISNLAKKGVQLYILSGGNAVEIRSCLKNNEIENYFCDILAEEQTKMNHLQMAKTTEKDLLIGDSDMIIIAQKV